MYQRLEEVLGREQAATLMEHLPPVGRADVATGRDVDQAEHLVRSDIDHLERHLRGEIARLGDRLRAEWRHELLLQTFALVGANVALVGAVVAVVGLG